MRPRRIPGSTIEFRLWGRYALFTDPLTKVGGEKFSYHVPTYEALKGVAKSIYWKPTLTWVIDDVRVMKRIRTQTKGVKPLNFSGRNDLSIYTFLADVEYQVRAHFEWNQHRPELSQDRVPGKHAAILARSLERGGRQDIFMGTRDCQAYVEPCVFGEGAGALDDDGELALGMMFHGFDYADEIGVPEFRARFWRPVMKNGYIRFARPEECGEPKFLRAMTGKAFGLGDNHLDVGAEALAVEEAQ
jgi:CRISPR-associated protein Cas5d